MIRPVFVFVFVFVIVGLTSCTSIDTQEVHTLTPAKAEVTITFSDLAITHIPDTSTRAAINTDYTQRIDLTIFDTSGSKVKTITQTTSDTNFGTIKDTLSVGTYKFVAVATGNPNGSIPSATANSATELSFDACPPYFTYTAVKDVSLTQNIPQSVSVTFGKRKTSTLGIVITDPTPSEVTKLQMIVSPSSTEASPYLINPSDGLASKQSRYERTITLEELSKPTFTNQSLGLQLFLTAPEEQLDITINALDATGQVLFTRTKTSVTFRQATVTRATGTLFSSITTTAFDIDYQDNTMNDITL